MIQVALYPHMSHRSSAMHTAVTWDITGHSFPSFFFTKKKFAAYGLHDSRIVPCVRCSCTNLWTSSISFWLRGRSRPGIVVGAPGSNSIAWSHIVCFGSRCDCSSLNTLSCLAYSFGREVFVILMMVGVVLHRRSCSRWMGLGWLIDRGKNRAFAALGALRTIGSCVWSIHPLFQSIFGCVATNQGYPSIALCSPSSVRKNLMLVVIDPVRVARSV